MGYVFVILKSIISNPFLFQYTQAWDTFPSKNVSLKQQFLLGSMPSWQGEAAGVEVHKKFWVADILSEGNFYIDFFTLTLDTEIFGNI